jgi:hypothetical protein
MNKNLTAKERATLIVIRIVVSLLVAGLPLGADVAGTASHQRPSHATSKLNHRVKQRRAQCRRTQSKLLTKKA